MPLEVGVDDIRQMFSGSLVLYKNKPTYVKNVHMDGEVQVLDIATQRWKDVPFNMKDFAPVTRRLGFINTKGSVVYACRLPVRRYKVGLNEENVRLTTLNVNYPHGKAETKDGLYNLSLPEVADTLHNKYPTFKECMEYVSKRAGAMAFDKQFAVASSGQVFYKTNVVGDIDLDKRSVKDIKWKAGKEYLLELIGDNYAKALRNSQSR